MVRQDADSTCGGAAAAKRGSLLMTTVELTEQCESLCMVLGTWKDTSAGASAVDADRSKTLQELLKRRHRQHRCFATRSHGQPEVFDMTAFESSDDDDLETAYAELAAPWCTGQKQMQQMQHQQQEPCNTWKAWNLRERLRHFQLEADALASRALDLHFTDLKRSASNGFGVSAERCRHANSMDSDQCQDHDQLVVDRSLGTDGEKGVPHTTYIETLETEGEVSSIVNRVDNATALGAYEKPDGNESLGSAERSRCDLRACSRSKGAEELAQKLERRLSMIEAGNLGWQTDEESHAVQTSQLNGTSSMCSEELAQKLSRRLHVINGAS